MILALKIRPADRISGKPIIFSKNNRLIPRRTMIELLKDIKEKLNAGVYKNEEQIRLTLVARVLQALGWNIWNPEEVFPEFIVVPNEDKTRVDIALFVSPRYPAAFIEVKAHGLLMPKLDQVEMQVRDYNRNHTATFSILTDGQHWRFYLSQAGGEFSQKCFQAINLLETELEDMESTFQTFLSKASHQNEAAQSEARHLLQLTQRQKDILSLRDEAKKLTEMAPFPRLPEALQTLAASKGIVATVEEISDILAGKVTKPRNTTPNIPQAVDPGSRIPSPESSTLNSNFDLILDPSRPADLGHTKVIEAALNGQPINNWKQLALAAIRLGNEREVPLNRLSRIANISGTPKSDSGFNPLPGTSLYVQGMDANKCWKTAFDLAKHLKVPIKVIFSWREKENVANAGMTALLEWKPD
jgi:Type I restriction enzyme R protein N terminus (HSDR_N)